VEINLLGVVNGCRAAVPLMRRQGSGVILNIASSAGFAAAPQMGACNASKAGVIALTETLAAELDGSGVQVSVAMPGFFRTGLLETMRAPAEESAMATPDGGFGVRRCGCGAGDPRCDLAGPPLYCLAEGIRLAVAHQAVLPDALSQARAAHAGTAVRAVGASTARMNRV
jgi:NAD(P)-dependent dehydrogenase (short-subunit alcohol dehydrogenase family)